VTKLGIKRNTKKLKLVSFTECTWTFLEEEEEEEEEEKEDGSEDDVMILKKDPYST
jgi:hypothetical protein